MSTLQISLAVAGGLVLAAVVAHGAWAARKNQPKQAIPEPVSPSDPSDASRSRPLAGDAHDPLQERREPAFDGAFNADDINDEQDASLQALTAMTAPEKKPVLDPLLDVIALIAIDAVVSGEAALSAMPPTRRAGSKPFAIEGLREGTDAPEWEQPTPGHIYTAFQAGVQLANRFGPLNQIEYSEFVIKARAFADAVNGEPEFPEMQDEVARARELDQFASEHDATLTFMVRAVSTAWSPGYVQQGAARLGFVSGSIPGRMTLATVQPGQCPLLVLVYDSQAAVAADPEQTALREFKLSLDVPQVHRSERPFVRMCEVALSLAASMDGIITDDHGSPVGAEAMESIHADLEGLYDTLDAREFSAGSALGRRLFS